ncbi:Cu2+-exporting ATPase [Sphingomonas laterariae]|uniref:Cu2+-exporting ATPase n=1 Tax=Edaphosphingomonas laterariae TaxID=861865 RepID=A0A239J470_9SPHN|nr:heavy metal translocating P-type ATPase [Sphingomonas laterariae]SNT00691.1 Cu2+-exporting ATPase [Sphingomonas laterariae]
MNAPGPSPTASTAFAETLISVPSLRCAGCIAKLEDGLAQAPGIAAARVNFTAKRVAIAHAPDMAVPDLLDMIGSLGFEAQPLAEAAETKDSESRQLVRAMAVAGFASMNVMLLSVSVWSGADGATRDLFHWLSALIALPTVAYSGRPFFKSAWAALRHGRTNMDVPIAIGVALVSALSLFETIVGGPHAYFDGAVMLLFFLLVGRVLDSVMRDRARDGVTALLKHTAPGALVLKPDGSTAWRDAQSLAPNMRMIVAAGERLAADGVIEKGESHFDRALMTGESAPQRALPGDAVHAGTLNLDAPVTVRVTAAGPDTAIADIARMMENAGQARSRYVRLADRAARLYAPAVHTLAALSFAGWMLAGAGWHDALLIAVAVLIITCPCALGLAVPAAQIVVAGALMRAGVLVKDGSALERLADADRALFDKTGTLTLGRPEPDNLADLSTGQQSVLLGLVRASRHPLSQALRRAIEAEGIAAADIHAIAETPGTGLSGAWQGKAVRLGRADDVDGAGSAMACRFEIAGETAITLRFHDQLRPGAVALPAELGALGISSSILSGDRTAAVAPVARALGLTAQTAMLPEDKLASIARLSAGGAKVLMVGDGLNDGPALAAGHVSMAPASASDAGQNAADAVWLGDSIAPVATAIRAARRTMRVVRQNFAIAIGYNMIAVPMAFLGYVTPLVAALAMSGSSLIVVGNALRLRKAAR